MGSSKLKILVTPRSSKERLLGWQGEELKISLTAPPVEGAANAALTKYLARLLDIAASQVKVSSGQASRHKTVTIEGLESQEITRKIENLLNATAKNSK
ncbi:MAG: DUF167 family protein [Deltaproteobacteria bacterium]|jgi:uncharacterized protein (TIGR00251 family)|nr:DUF167 family protein [Deltaproteobacteria bacterium]